MSRAFRAGIASATAILLVALAATLVLAQDELAAAGQLTLDAGGTVGGDLIVTGGQVDVAGSVAGSVEGAAGAYSRTGSVGGTEHVVVEEATEEEDAAGEAANDVFDALRHFVVLLILGA